MNRPPALPLPKSAVRVAPPPAPGWRRAMQRYGLPLAFLSPSVLLVFLVTFFPIAYAIYVSLHRTEYLKVGAYVGFSHFVQFLTQASGRNNVAKSLVFVAATLGLALPLGTALAILLNQPIRWRGFFRTVLILPWLLSQVVTALLWGWLLHYQAGPVNYVLREWFSQPVDFLGRPWAAMASVVLAEVWRSFPYPMLLVLAALQNIPDEVLEAAVVDGANPWQRFWRVTFPLLLHTILTTTIVLSLHYFNMVTLPLVLTGGGPVSATELMTVRVYREAFEFHNLGFSSAVAIYIFLFNVVFSLLYIRILRAGGDR